MSGSATAARSLRLVAKLVLPAFLVLAIGAFAQSASAKYLLVKLKESPSYDAAYGKVHQQLTALQLRRTSSTKLAECRNEPAIRWLDEQLAEIATWPAGAIGRTTAALSAELANEVAEQSKLQLCKGARAQSR